MDSAFEKLPIDGHASNNLTHEEQQLLYAAARDSQEVFDQLADDEEMRLLLESPQVRRELIAAIEVDERTFTSRFLSWGRRPLVPVLAAGFGAVLAIGLLWNLLHDRRLSEEPSPVHSSLVYSAAFTARLFSIPVSPPSRDLGGPTLEVQALFRIGNSFRVRFSAPPGSRVFLIERRPSGSLIQHFPSTLQPESSIGESGEVTVPASDRPAPVVSSEIGAHKLRLIIFPPGVDPLVDFNSASKPSVIEEEFRVEP